MKINKLKDLKDLTIEEAVYFYHWCLPLKYVDGIYDGSKFMVFYEDEKLINGYIDEVDRDALKRMRAEETIEHLKATSNLL